jgi:adenine-specific DNA methylase
MLSLQQCFPKEKALFTHGVAADIDAWSRVIPRRDDHAWACLLHQVAKRANGMGKQDTPMTLMSEDDKRFHVVPISFVGSTCEEVVVTGRDVSDVSDDCTFDRVYDLVYVDPPYTTSSLYQTEYHVLNTLALGDRPVVKGMYHTRADTKRSQFASRRHAKSAFERLVDAVHCRWIAISYSDAGILSLDELQEIVRNAGYTRDTHGPGGIGGQCGVGFCSI